MIDIPEHTHNNDPTNDIYNVYITPYSDYKLILTDKNYKNPPPRLPGEPIIFIKNKIFNPLCEVDNESFDKLKEMIDKLFN